MQINDIGADESKFDYNLSNFKLGNFINLKPNFKNLLSRTIESLTIYKLMHDFCETNGGNKLLNQNLICETYFNKLLSQILIIM